MWGESPEAVFKSDMISPARFRGSYFFLFFVILRKDAGRMQVSGCRLTNIVPAAGCCIECRLQSAGRRPQKKSDKNLRHSENLVYYIQEMRKKNLPRYIRRICRRVRSFLCFRNPRCLCRPRGFCVLLPAKSGILYV